MNLKDLFLPKWKHSNLEVRKKAIEALIDTTILSKIAKTDTDLDVRKQAKEKCDYLKQVELWDNAKGKDEYQRKNIVQQIKDITILFKILKTERNWIVREAIVKKVYDQDILKYAALKDNNWQVRVKAINKLEDQNLIFEIVQSETDAQIRAEAVSRLNNPEIVFQIYKNDNDERVRIEAIKKNSNQDSLLKIVLNDESLYCKKEAIKNISDQNIIGSIILSSLDIEIKKYASKMMTVSNQQLIREILDKDIPQSVKEILQQNLRGKNAKAEFEKMNKEDKANKRNKVKLIQPVTWVFDEESVALCLQRNWKDSTENRKYTDFDNLKKASDWKHPNYSEDIKLCNKQINETPDFDGVYLIIAQHNILKNNFKEAIACLCAGLQHCKRKSFLLTKLGDIYFKLESPIASMFSFTKSIIASIGTTNLDYIPFLNLAYLFQFSGYQNASIVAKEKSDKLSIKDYRNVLDFDNIKINQLKQMVHNNKEQMESWSLKCIEDLDEYGWNYI